MFILLLAICVRFRQTPNNRYHEGLCGAFSSFIVMILSVAQTINLCFRDSTRIKCVASSPILISRHSQLALGTMESLAGLIALICFLSFPQRPEVYLDNGRVVDREHTVSAISRYTFQWCTPLLDLAAQKESLNASDLPSTTHATRAQTLHYEFLSSSKRGPLWKRILSTHLRAFLLQWTLTLLQSGFEFIPQLSLYNLLRQLERRQVGDTTTHSMQIMWCAALGLGLLLNEWVQAQLYWIAFAQLATPIRAQLSALLFAKALRRKNFTGPRATAPTSPRSTVIDSNGVDEDKDPSVLKIADNEVITTAVAAAPVVDDSDAILAAQKSSQATINLLGVDATRIADFCSMNCFLVNSVFKACISFAFLIYLIGWRALLAGICSFALITPLTTLVTKRYSMAQKALMAVRDERLDIMTQTLMGIRGIKFAALENVWEARIGAVRARELGILW